MACLWIDNRNAIHKNGYLVVRSTIDADVRLNTKPSALPDIYAC